MNFDTPEIYGKVLTGGSNEPTVEEMTCEQILRNDWTKLGYIQSFDGSWGKIALVGGRDCWKEIQDSVVAADEYVRDKLESLTEKGVDLHSLALPYLDEYDRMYNTIPNYSDGLTLFTSWTWKDSHVAPGQEMGLCLEQGEGTMASCWGFTRNEDGTYATKNRSHQINLGRMNGSEQLSDYPDIGAYATPAFNGSWLCSKVYSLEVEQERNIVACLRFMPKQELASMADPRFNKGNMKIVTYLEGRTNEEEGENISDLEVKLEEKVEENKEIIREKLSGLGPSFEMFNIHISLSAFNSLAVSATAITLALVHFTF